MTRLGGQAVSGQGEQDLDAHSPERTTVWLCFALKQSHLLPFMQCGPEAIGHQETHDKTNQVNRCRPLELEAPTYAGLSGLFGLSTKVLSPRDSVCPWQTRMFSHPAC